MLTLRNNVGSECELIFRLAYSINEGRLLLIAASVFTPLHQGNLLYHYVLLCSVRSHLRGCLQDSLDPRDVQDLGAQLFIYNSWSREMWSTDIWQSGVRGQV